MFVFHILRSTDDISKEKKTRNVDMSEFAKNRKLMSFSILSYIFLRRLSFMTDIVQIFLN
jgi:hypothetical protein